MHLSGRRLLVELDTLKNEFVAADNAGSVITAASTEQAIGCRGGFDAALVATHDNISSLYDQFGVFCDGAGNGQRVGVLQQLGFDARQRPDLYFDSRDGTRIVFMSDGSHLVEQGQTDRKLMHTVDLQP